MTDRRAFLIGLMVACLTPRFASGGHDPCAMSNSRAAWDAWKAAFLADDGRVVDHQQGGSSHSESQGYGLVLSVFHGDRTVFERISTWTEANLSQRDDGLLNWRLSPGSNVAETNNATDGDIFYAWGLALGSKRFEMPNARSRAITVARAIADHCLANDPRNSERLVILPAAQGFRRGVSVIVNPSYIMPRALFDLASLARDQRLAKAAADGLLLLEEIAQQGLAPDWVQIDAVGVNPSFEHPVTFGYDAIRVPLYLIWSGNRTHAAVLRAKQMYDRLAATETPVVTDLEGNTAIESSHYPGFQAIKHLVSQADDTEALKRRPAFDPAQGYYPATLELLAALARRETAPVLCPG